MNQSYFRILLFYSHIFQSLPLIVLQFRIAPATELRRIRPMPHIFFQNEFRAAERRPMDSRLLGANVPITVSS